MNRKQRRAAEKRRKKGDPQQLMQDKITLFHKLPEQCDACREPFDKKNKEMAFTWNVVVKEEIVRLFCPACMKKAKDLINKGEINGT